MGKLINFKLVKKNIWACPECGYLISVIEKVYAKENYPCPRCGKSRFNDFKLVKKG